MSLPFFLCSPLDVHIAMGSRRVEDKEYFLKNSNVEMPRGEPWGSI